jgi:hypothetical protein
MVKMHIAMTLGHLSLYEDSKAEIIGVLFDLLEDESVFAASWAIVSLCIIGIKYPREGDRIVSRIAGLQGHRSAAIRSRVKKALNLLTKENVPFPEGWIKSEHLKALRGQE